METHLRSLLATENKAEPYTPITALILIAKTLLKMLTAQLLISNRPICRYFSSGNCHFGDKCLYRHYQSAFLPMPTPRQPEGRQREHTRQFCHSPPTPKNECAKPKQHVYQRSPYSTAICLNEDYKYATPTPAQSPPSLHDEGFCTKIDTLFPEKSTEWNPVTPVVRSR